MKKNKTLVLLSIVLGALALFVAFIPQDKVNKKSASSPNEVLQSFLDGIHYIAPQDLADILVQKDPNYIIIDVRTAEEYNTFHLPNAINIPLHSILANEWEEVLNQDVYTNVFYSNGTVQANQAWMLCRLKGYINNYVLEGGLNFWAETIMNPKAPQQTAPNDEFAKYNFAKAANSALGGGALEQTQSTSSSSTAKPTVPLQKKKKRAAGGCS